MEQVLSSSTTLELSTSSKRKGELCNVKNQDALKHKRARIIKAGAQEHIDVVNGINMAIGGMDSQLLADYFAQSTKRFNSELSLVELEDRYLPGGY